MVDPFCDNCGLPYVEITPLPVSPWPTKLGRFAHPSQQEAQRIVDCICKAYRCLSHLDAERKQLVAVLDQLDQRRSEFLAQIAYHRALVAPIRRLPAELLLEIFRHIIPSRSSYRIDDVPRRHSTVLTLAQICTRWRAVVISTPDFWSSMKLYVSDRVLRMAPTMVPVWFTRMGNQPLSLALRNEQRTKISHVTEVVTLLASRLAHIQLDLWPDSSHEVLVHGGPFPLLKSITLDNSSFRFEANGEEALPFYSHITCLPWHKMTEIAVMAGFRCTLSFCYDILRHCPKLTKCMFHRITAPRTAVHIPIVHTHLRVFSSHSKESTHLSQLLDLLTLPALREMHTWTLIPHASFESLLLRSACNMDRLSCIVDPGYDNIYAVSRHMKRLVELNIESSTGMSMLLQFTRPISITREGKSYLCPNLQVLNIIKRGETSDPSSILHMLRSRWDASPNSSRLAEMGVTRLCSACISLERPGMGFLRDVRKLRQQGACVSVKNLDGVNWLS